MSKKIFRCAIYTRKSTEEGLEQEFNSLDAQREASEAYIKSQKHEGWEAVAAAYDDGGYSGGNMERPALKKLLADIESGKIDVIVVYKVDRLSRALSDFAKMVEVFDKHGVSFVSVTQQFNTTTSMGRLTLNVLLSFAQFEREVTGERIRDKFAASKKKGMWMGGPQPLGYDVIDRKLVINTAEAEIIKFIFEYCADKSKREPLWQLLDQLRTKNYKNKSYTSRKGNAIIGKDFSRSQIYNILSNTIYNGKIKHKDQIHEGEHQAIIDDELWNKVRGRISKQDFARNPNKKAEQPKLAGKIFDYLGNRLSATYSYKYSAAGRYKMRYYVNREISKQGKTASEFKRIRAEHIDNIVIAETAGIIEVLTSAISRSHNNELSSVILRPLSDLLSDPAQLISKVVLFPQHLELLLSLDTKGKLLSEDSFTALKNILISHKAEITASPESAILIKLKISTQYKKSSGQLHIITDHSDVSESETEANYYHPDDKTFTLIAKAFYWNKQIKNHLSKGNKEISIEDNHSPAYVKRALRQRFLSPRIIAQITSNTQPSQITAEELINLHHWSWQMQEELLF